MFHNVHVPLCYLGAESAPAVLVVADDATCPDVAETAEVEDVESTLVITTVILVVLDSALF